MCSFKHPFYVRKCFERPLFQVEARYANAGGDKRLGVKEKQHLVKKVEEQGVQVLPLHSNGPTGTSK